MVIPFIIKGRWYERLISILSVPLLVNAFILCNSRGAFVALALSAMVVTVFFPNKQVKKVMIAAIICSIPIFLYLSDPYFIERILTLKGSSEVSMSNPEANELSSGRLEVWRYGMKMVKDHPAGVGPEGFKYLARFYMPSNILTFHSRREYGIRSAHNTYLQVLVEQGYVGLGIFLIMCIQTLRLLSKAIKKLIQTSETNGFWGYIILALSISFCSILLGGLFNSRVYYEFFWWQIAIIVAAYSYLMRDDHIVQEEQID